MYAASPIHSLLFVPGSRPERFPKALASAAHLVCIDLEDGVAPESKVAARRAVLDFLPNAPLDRLAVRINGLTTRSGLVDLLALAEAPVRPRLILVPKVKTAAELAIAASALGDALVSFMPTIESAEALANAVEIARAPQCTAVSFGGSDLAGDLGVSMAWEPLFAARAAIILACARAGVPAFDVPFINIDDKEGLEDETNRVKALGFAAKAAIHPSQIEIINRVFRPTAGEIAEARAAIAAHKASNGGAIQFQGKLLEGPIVRRYERTLAAAGEC